MRTLTLTLTPTLTPTLTLTLTLTLGYSTSRTCEMSLSNHSGINFRSILYLVDEATTAKPKEAAASR